MLCSSFELLQCLQIQTVSLGKIVLCLLPKELIFTKKECRSKLFYARDYGGKEWPNSAYNLIVSLVLEWLKFEWLSCLIKF